MVVDLFAQRGIAPPGQAQQPQAGGGGDLFAQRGIAPPGQPQPGPGQAQAATAPQPGQEQLGLVESAAQGAAQGVTFGFADELYGLGAGLIPGGQNREEATKSARARLAKANPAAMLAGELAGSVLLPGGAIKSGVTAGARALRGAAAGTAAGAAGGLGRAEGTLQERAPAAAAGGAIGGVLGGAGAAAAPAVADGVRRLVGQGSAPTAVQKLLNTAQTEGAIGENAQRAIGNIQAAAAGRKQAVNEAYHQISKMSGAVEDKASFELLSNKFNRVLDEGGVEFLEGGDRIAGLADRVVSQLEGGATPEKMEKARQLIAKVTRGASPQNPQERLHLSQLQESYDDWMFDTLTNKLYRGDQEAVDQIKNARGLAKEYNDLFGRYTGGSGTAERTAGGMISRIMQDDVEAEEAVNLIFGAGAAGVKGSRQALARIRDASPEAFEQLQAAHFTKLVSGEGKGDFLDGPAIAKKIQKLNASGPLAKTLYGDKMGELNRFGQKLQAGESVPSTIVRFISRQPALMRAVVGGAGGAMLSGDPVTGAFGALLASGFSKKGASLGKLNSAAAAPATGISRRIGQVGGTAGASVGPSLAGG